MSVMNEVLKQQQTESYELTLREAAMTVLVGAVAADGIVGPFEGDRLHELLSSTRLFRQVPPDHLQRLMENALDLVTHTPADDLLPACAAVIPPDLRAALYALAVELVFVDGAIAEREKQFCSKLQAAFAIDDETAMGIVEVLLIRNRA
jgi:uncharacterized tellurite resistance protein B-like protein